MHTQTISLLEKCVRNQLIMIHTVSNSRKPASKSEQRLKVVDNNNNNNNNNNNKSSMMRVSQLLAA